MLCGCRECGGDRSRITPKTRDSGAYAKRVHRLWYYDILLLRLTPEGVDMVLFS